MIWNDQKVAAVYCKSLAVTRTEFCLWRGSHIINKPWPIAPCHALNTTPTGWNTRKWLKHLYFLKPVKTRPPRLLEAWKVGLSSLECSCGKETWLLMAHILTAGISWHAPNCWAFAAIADKLLCISLSVASYLPWILVLEVQPAT